ncbi:phosphohexomutase domain-containing protein [Anianabacter salinae]|uniref:phosphomannomutase n=1 Tax=Anianabacter salinae TaxID=2851023 RepID=UPI00225DD9D9|nr:phosphomannomutase [Anianabacter salinae]MBV0911705.1 phosphomannomutase [Anianabacter salinae]
MLTCFKSYDVRGTVGVDLDASIAARIGRAFARVTAAREVVLGRDARDTSPMLLDAVARGLMDEGVQVIDIGLCGTEEVYFATEHFGADGGMMITASHNPVGDNGIKMVRAGARPISRASGLAEMAALVEADAFGPALGGGSRRSADPRADYVARVMSFVDPGTLGAAKVLVNAGNGAAGPTFDALAGALAQAGAALQFERMHHDPDPAFPNGIPNPLLQENRPVTGDAVRAHRADLGVAWDGDFDRCFLFDETGAFVDGEYVVGLLAAAVLSKDPGAAIVHDPRVQWNTQSIVAAQGGRAVASPTGHALMKERMRAEDAAYGGEMSAHHYFRDFMYCDSGMIPWLLVLAHMADTGKPLSALVAGMRAAHPSSGEINFRLADPAAAVAAVEADYGPKARDTDRLDGLSLSFGDWRLNLRQSNTEAMLRLNIEARGDAALVAEKVAEVSALIRRAGSAA